MKTIVTLALLIALNLAAGEDASLAAGLATTGAKLAIAGKTEQAEQVLYRALVYDEHCGPAYFELAKLAEKSGDKDMAESLYSKANANVFDKYTKHITPLRIRLQAAVAEYATALDKLDLGERPMLRARISESRVLLGIPQKMTTPQPPQSPFVGKWKKQDGTTIVLAVDKSIDFSADPSGGEWQPNNATEFTIKFGWGKTVKCALINQDSFVEVIGGKNKWTRVN